MSLYNSETREVWAAIHPEHGLVCGISDIEHYTFAQAVKNHRPCEVRRMMFAEAHESLGRFLGIKKGEKT